MLPLLAPLASAGPLILQNWKLIAFIMTVMSGIIYIQFLKSEITERDIIVQKQEFTIEGFKKDVARRNSEIQHWHDIGKAQEKKINSLQASLRIRRTTTSKKVQDILNEKTPTTCPESIEYLLKGTEELKWKK
jgi:hypothetical protein